MLAGALLRATLTAPAIVDAPVAGAVALPGPVGPGAMITDGGCTTSNLPRNDRVFAFGGAPFAGSLGGAPEPA